MHIKYRPITALVVALKATVDKAAQMTAINRPAVNILHVDSLKYKKLLR